MSGSSKPIAVDGDHEGPVCDAVGDDHSLPERLGVEVGMIGLRPDGRRVDQYAAPASEYARATSGNHWSQQVGKPNRRRRFQGSERIGSAGPGYEIAVLVVAGGERDM